MKLVIFFTALVLVSSVFSTPVLPDPQSPEGAKPKSILKKLADPNALKRSIKWGNIETLDSDVKVPIPDPKTASLLSLPADIDNPDAYFGENPTSLLSNYHKLIKKYYVSLEDVFNYKGTLPEADATHVRFIKYLLVRSALVSPPTQKLFYLDYMQKYTVRMERVMNAKNCVDSVARKIESLNHIPDENVPEWWKRTKIELLLHDPIDGAVLVLRDIGKRLKTAAKVSKASRDIELYRIEDALDELEEEAEKDGIKNVQWAVKPFADPAVSTQGWEKLVAVVKSA